MNLLGGASGLKGRRPSMSSVRPAPSAEEMMIGKHKTGRDEPILEPALPIIDAHHHLFIRPGVRYLFEDYLEDVALGHDIRASVYVETRFLSRPHGPEALRPLGEIEFANGVAAMSASGMFGPCRVAAAIVGYADLTLGDEIEPYLDRAQAAAPDRFRGVRQIAMSHSDPRVLANLGTPPKSGLLQHPVFQEGLAKLAMRGLLFEATILHHQLPELTAIAERRPELTIVLDHMGLALAANMDTAGRKEVFVDWRRKLADLARNGQVYCKVGGLGSSYWGFGFDERAEPPGFLEL